MIIQIFKNFLLQSKENIDYCEKFLNFNILLQYYLNSYRIN